MDTEPRPEETTSDADQAGLVGNEIRKLRKVRKLTLSGLGERTGLSVGYLSQIERNLSSPTVKALFDISHALGVSINWFFHEVTRRSVTRTSTSCGVSADAAFAMNRALSTSYSIPIQWNPLNFFSAHLNPGQPPRKQSPTLTWVKNVAS